MHQKDRLGRYGERFAAAYLERQGMKVLDRNWRCSEGEIDLVARDGRAIVVCEVKTRSGRGYGTPLEGVDEKKLGRLYRLAGRWLTEHHEPWARGVRVDLLGILCEPGREPVVEHLRGVC